MNTFNVNYIPPQPQRTGMLRVYAAIGLLAMLTLSFL